MFDLGHYVLGIYNFQLHGIKGKLLEQVHQLHYIKGLITSRTAVF